MQTELAGDALARACAEAMLSRDRAAQALGITLEEAREGYARGLMTVTESMINGHDTAHGGVTFTFADTIFALACNSRNVPHVALNVTMSFTAAAKLGDTLRAEGRELTLKGRTGVYDITVVNAESGKLIGLFRGTCYRIHGTVLLEEA